MGQEIAWTDLTVANATEVSDFYSAVLGWEKEALSMGDYDDYVMKDAQSANGVAGVCHSRGVNADLPAQWLIYVNVANLDESLEKCKQMGGKVLGEKRSIGNDSFCCLIQDPAGAYMMICGK